MLGIPGEDLKNAIPARKIVGWYNGLPGDQDLDINLNVESMAIVGQGNVAMDVARILLAPIDELKVNIYLFKGCNFFKASFRLLISLNTL